MVSNITAVNGSSETRTQCAVTETMLKVMDDLRQNRPKKFQDHDLTGIKVYQRYRSLPNIPMQSVSEGETVPIGSQSTNAVMLQVFSDLRENRRIVVDDSGVERAEAQRLSKSMPDIAFPTNAGVDAPDGMPFTQMSVFPDSPSAETTADSAVMNLELIDIDAKSSASQTFPPQVKPVESDRENRRIVVDDSGVERSEAQILSKSMPDIAFPTNAGVDAPDGMPSTQTSVFPDSPSAETTADSAVTNLELIDIDAKSSASQTFPPQVKLVESDALSSIRDIASQSIAGDAESNNGSADPLDLETVASLQDIVSLCGHENAAKIKNSVTAARPKRRSLWSRVKKFARRMVCCGLPDVDCLDDKEFIRDLDH
ncbi:uncharacterized protein LOC115034480 [Acyrthosiphon pisum]|uniref:Uncharacterized protein n=1 Tax=Acyrthosiphon pisum TaxID=7029 RepID=A0A8R2JVU5_ACYPI|nr:uncharacterized protein LOC115034480 [Acyrthosiphon pisum]